MPPLHFRLTPNARLPAARLLGRHPVGFSRILIRAGMAKCFSGFRSACPSGFYDPRPWLHGEVRCILSSPVSSPVNASQNGFSIGRQEEMVPDPRLGAYQVLAVDRFLSGGLLGIHGEAEWPPAE
jgi:hypothetical protein